MDKPESGQSTGDYEGGDDPIVPPVHVLPADYRPHSGQGTNNEDIGQSDYRHPPYHVKQPLWERYISREKIGWDRVVELLFAGAIVLFSWLQYESSQATSKQIQAMIDASQEIKTAAWVFSGAAQGINNAGWSAVGKLNDQATQMKGSVEQMRRVATATEAVNRPYVGNDGATAIRWDKDNSVASLDLIYRDFGPIPAESLSIKVRTFFNNWTEIPMGVDKRPPLTLMPGQIRAYPLDYMIPYGQEIASPGNSIYLCITFTYINPKTHRQYTEKQGLSHGTPWPPTQGPTWGSFDCRAEYY